MPGLDYFSTPENGVSISTAPVQLNHEDSTPSPMESSAPGVYYNPRLDPKNYLEGPLSPNPATRLRQMLARPGIVVRDSLCMYLGPEFRLLQVAPGICDGISARCALEAGFDCLYQRFVLNLLFNSSS